MEFGEVPCEGVDYIQLPEDSVRKWAFEDGDIPSVSRRGIS